MSMELWDLLDKDRRPLGQTHPRGRQYPHAARHLSHCRDGVHGG